MAYEVKRVPLSEPEFEEAVASVGEHGQRIVSLLAAGDGAAILVLTEAEKKRAPGGKETRA